MVVKTYVFFFMMYILGTVPILGEIQQSNFVYYVDGGL